MASPIQRLLKPEPGPEQEPPPESAVPPSFKEEFVRVQSDKLILLLLIVFLFWMHASSELQAAAVGGLIMLIQGQRFRR